MSFRDLVAGLRIQRAQELLVNSTWSIKQIAAQCGYDQAQSFDRRFKSILGATPSDWRSRMSQAASLESGPFLPEISGGISRNTDATRDGVDFMSRNANRTQERIGPHSRPSLPQPDPIGYAARRWMDLVIRGLRVTDDSHTVAVWCKSIAVARGTLQKRCHAVGVRPKDSLDFMRLLRVAIQHAGEPWDLQSWLDVADDRTARALLRRAGFDSCCCAPSLDAFLPHQRLIRRSDLILVLRARMARLGVLISDHDRGVSG